MKINCRRVIFILFTFGYLAYKGFKGYNDGKNWEATIVRNEETFIITSSKADKFLEDYKIFYHEQKNIDSKKLAFEIIGRVHNLIIDDQISVHGLLNELEKLDQVLDNPFLTNNDRENFFALREVIVDPLREYGEENPDFLEAFNAAEIAMLDYRKLYLDPDIINLQKTLVEEGLESCGKLVKKIAQTSEGREKLQKLFSGSTLDGKNFLEMLEKINDE